MSENDKLRYAISYLDKLIKGKNPNTDGDLFDVSDKDNAGIVNCLSFVKMYLEKQVSEQKTVPVKFVLTEQARRSLKLYPEGLSITKFVETINSAAREPGMERLRGRQVTSWLMKNGYLEYRILDGKEFRAPTEKGLRLGISAHEYTTDGKPYLMNVYNPDAQEFILDHMQDIIQDRLISEE